MSLWSRYLYYISVSSIMEVLQYMIIYIGLVCQTDSSHLLHISHKPYTCKQNRNNFTRLGFTCLVLQWELKTSCPLLVNFNWKKFKYFVMLKQLFASYIRIIYIWLNELQSVFCISSLMQSPGSVGNGAECPWQWKGNQGLHHHRKQVSFQVL